MKRQLDAGPLQLRVIEPSSSTRIDLSGEADGAPVPSRGHSERAAKVAAEAKLKKQRDTERQAAEKAAADKLKAVKAATLKRTQATERQANARKAQALGLGMVACAHHPVAYVMPMYCFCNASVMFM
jgi:sRNA-binding protein